MDSKPVKSHSKRTTIITVLLLCAVAIAAVTYYTLGRTDPTVLPNVPVAQAEPDLIYNGQPYARREGVRAILLMGIDWPDESASLMEQYQNGGQADFLLLVILDDENKQVQQWQIDRDSIVDINMLGLMGDDAGLIKAQICLSHSYGDGKAQSCGFTVQAVERLLRHVRVDYYAAMSIDDVAALNDTVGGVEVTLSDDFSAFDADMAAGKTLRLTGEQASLFVQRRWDIDDGSNLSRMWRHRAFLAALLRQAEEMIRENPAAMETLVMGVLNNMVTDMTLVSVMEEAGKALDYQRTGMEMLAGEHTMSANGYVEFIVDEDALEARVVDTFFKPIAP